MSHDPLDFGMRLHHVSKGRDKLRLGFQDFAVRAIEREVDIHQPHTVSESLCYQPVSAVDGVPLMSVGADDDLHLGPKPVDD
jgi:hypothetical protein